MDMLALDKLKSIGFIVLSLTVIISCKNILNYSNHLGEEIFKISTSKLGEQRYKQILQMANDSISSWKSNNLGGWRGDPKSGEALLDTIFCINNGLNKVVMANLGSVFPADATLDAIGFFYGVKIKEEWYFFGGPTAYIPRDEDSLNSPTSFTKLHEIAMQEVFSGYLKRKDLGFWRNVFGKTEYEVNEAFFAFHFEGPGWDRNCRNAECYEKLYLAKVRNNWAHRDTTNYKHLK